MYTDYDELRDELRDDLKECLKKVKKMFDEDISGFELMRGDYIIEVYQAIKKAKDAV
jgi:pyruvate dehydrogenase complex dehydrogenase (E1) component